MTYNVLSGTLSLYTTTTRRACYNLFYVFLSTSFYKFSVNQD